jgi:hypothetical protein
MAADFLPLKLAWAMAAVALVATIGFNRPSWARSHTTALRWGVAMACHALLQMLVLLLLFFAAQQAIAWSGTLGAMGGLVRPSTAVWTALGATLVLFAVPAVEAAPRRLLHRLAGVPDVAAALAAQLRGADFRAPDDVIERARFIMQSRGVDEQRMALEQAAPTQRLLRDTTALYVQLRDWESQPAFSHYCEHARVDLELFREQFDRLTLQVSRMFGRIESLGMVKHELAGHRRADGLLRKLVEDMLAELCTETEAVRGDACLLLARGILCARATADGRHALARRLGFLLEPAERAASWRPFALAGALLYLGVGFFFVLVAPRAERSIGTPALVLVITLSQLAALALAIVPKLHWGFANAGLERRTPTGFVLAAGLAAVAFAAVLNLLAGGLLAGGWSGAWQRLGEAVPYLFAPFVTAAAVAWLVQDHRWSGVEPGLRRWLDAAFLGIAWVAASVAGAFAGALRTGAAIDPAALAAALAGSFALGALIGLVAIAAFRIDAIVASQQPPAAPARRPPRLPRTPAGTAAG